MKNLNRVNLLQDYDFQHNVVPKSWEQRCAKSDPRALGIRLLSVQKLQVRTSRDNRKK